MRRKKNSVKNCGVGDNDRQAVRKKDVKEKREPLKLESKKKGVCTSTACARMPSQATGGRPKTNGEQVGFLGPTLKQPKPKQQH